MPRWLTALVTVFAFLLCTLSGGHGWAQEPPPAPPSDENLAAAKTHFEAGREAYSRQDYKSAVSEFKMAQAIRPSPVLDYNIGLAYEGLARPKAAVKYYQRYLQGKPDAANRPEVEQRITALSAQTVAAPPPPPNGGYPPNGNNPPPPTAGDDTGPAPPPVAPPAQYAYGSDPYGGAYQPPPPAKKRGSRWWIVFPILGGVTILVLLALFEAGAFTTNRVALLTAGVSAPPSHANEPGVLFRF